MPPHMPTLGFLKKKKTKESHGQNDLASPTSSSSQAGSPATPTSKAFDTPFASASSQSTAPTLHSQSNSQSALPSNIDGSAADGDVPMTQGISQHQQNYAATAGAPSQQDHHGVLPSIKNLIHPPQNDGANQSYPSSQIQSPTMGETQSTQPRRLTATQMLPLQHDVIPKIEARTTKGKYTLGDFELLRTLGTGSFGRVHLVQSKHNQRFYAVKVLKKAQVVKMKQVEHTNDERRMLQETKHPFLITLWGTFQDSKNLYMVMDFVEGGELFSLLRKSQVLVLRS